MGESTTKLADRNSYVDIVRGIAMLLVILGHTITGCTEGAEKSFLFNVIWSLQMPLFVLVSGYVTRYSRKTESVSTLWKYVKRRTIAYLLPWVVWTFIVRGLIFKKTHFFNIGWLLYHMDAGYWFLTTIWTISMIFGVSTFFASKAANSHEKKRYILIFVFYCIGMVMLAGIGLLMGMSFLGIRLTLYYMPFYFAGYLYGQFRDMLQSTKRGIKFTEIIVAVCLAVWLFILVRVPLYNLSDSVLAIALRASTSLTGSIAICGLCKKVFENENSHSTTVGGVLKQVGIHSMEMYVTHYLFLTALQPDQVPMMSSIQGLQLWSMNYIIAIFLTIVVIHISIKSIVLRFLLFGREI